MADDPSWLLRCQTDVLSAARADAQGLWNDSASQHVEQRYLRPHETEASRIIEMLALQEAELAETKAFVARVEAHAVIADLHAAEVVVEAEQCQQTMSAAYGYRDRALTDEGLAARHEQAAINAANAANQACGGCPAEDGYSGSVPQVDYHVPTSNTATTGGIDALLEAKGLQMIDLSQVDFSDNPITDWRGAPPEDYEWAARQWADVVAPDIEQGMTEDDFRAMDEQSGATGRRRLHGVYEHYFADPIRVERRADGTWNPIGGRHRIEAARRQGLTRLPASVVGT